MLEAFERIECAMAGTQSHDDEVILTFEERQKSRHKVETASGKSLGWFIERGVVMADGDILVCRDGLKIKVVAASELVSQINSNDPLALTKAAYHLGNRHVSLQIGQSFLRYQHDHVLDEMVQGLGLEVNCSKLPFHPEPGAYHGKGHGHSHSHSHNHEHEH